MTFRLLAAALLLASASRAAPSPKRGVCAQKMSRADFRALSPGVSWWYNWYFEPDGDPPEDGPVFVPMLWGDSPDLWKGVARYLKENPRPPVLLCLNEPNLSSQANLNPEAAAHAWLRAGKIADRYGVPLAGPHLAIGTPPDEVLSAYDPVQKKEVAYTWMVPFWEAFRHFLPKEESPAVGIHPYGNAGEVKWAVGEMAGRTGKPVWVTEFNWWDAKDEDAAVAYMEEAVAFLEASPDVAGYAWFMARLEDQPTRSLLAAEPGRLTRLGETYVNLAGGGSPGVRAPGNGPPGTTRPGAEAATPRPGGSDSTRGGPSARRPRAAG